MEKVIFFPLCHFVIIFSCVAVMTPSFRENTIGLFFSWFWSLVSESYKWKSGGGGRSLLRKNLFSPQVCHLWKLSFSFYLSMLPSTETPKQDLTVFQVERWNTVLLGCKKKLQYVLSDRLGNDLPIKSCLTHKGKNHCSKILDCPAFCTSYNSIRPLSE